MNASIFQPDLDKIRKSPQKTAAEISVLLPTNSKEPFIGSFFYAYD